MTGQSNEDGVKIGQVWRDCDPRSDGRRVTVVEVGPTHATVTCAGRKTRIRLDRFKPGSTGYQLVTSPEGNVP